VQSIGHRQIRGGTAQALAIAAVLVLASSLVHADTVAAGQQAKALLDSLEKAPETKRIARDPLNQARGALERAQSARQSRDEAHAALLDSLALEWAQTARDLASAADLEKRASEVQEQAAKAEAQSVRAQAIVEAAVARRGRARERIEVLGEAGAKVPDAAGTTQPEGNAP
jgi:hypothetical protein